MRAYGSLILVALVVLTAAAPPADALGARAGTSPWALQVRPDYPAPGPTVFEAGPPAAVTVGVTPPGGDRDYVVVVEVQRPYQKTIVCGQRGARVCTVALNSPNLDGKQDETLTFQVFVIRPSGGQPVAQSGPIGVTFSVVPPTPGMTWDDVRKARKSASEWHIITRALALTAGVATICAGFATVPIALAWYGGTAGVAAYGSFEASGQESGATDKAKDPVDPNFTQMATAVIPAPLLLPDTAGINPALVAAYNAFATNAAEESGITAALVTSLNRAHGALHGGSKDWAARQLAVAAGFAARDARLVGAEPGLLAGFRDAAAAAGMRVTVSAAEAQQIEQAVRANGLLRAMNHVLLAHGMDPRSLDRMARYLAAAPGPVTLPDLLTDPGLLAAIDGEAAALRAFALRNAKPGAVSAVVLDPVSRRRAGTMAANPMAASSNAIAGALTANRIDGDAAPAAAQWRQFAAGACPAVQPVPVLPKPPVQPAGGPGDLQQSGAITVDQPLVSAGYTVDDAGAKSAGGTATLDTPFGKATYRWTVPARITRAGVQATLTLTADAGRAGKSSNLEAELYLAGELNTVCPKTNSDCAHIRAYTTSGKTDTATATVTIKASNYSTGRTDPVLVKIGCAWGGPTITIPYRIIQ